MTHTRLTIRPPADFDLARDACSYGYFLLAPNVWDPIERSLTRTLELTNGLVELIITQPSRQPGNGISPPSPWDRENPLAPDGARGRSHEY